MWSLMVLTIVGRGEEVAADSRPGGAARTEIRVEGISLSFSTDAIVGYAAHSPPASTLTRYSSCGVRLCKGHCLVHSGKESSLSQLNLFCGFSG